MKKMRWLVIVAMLLGTATYAQTQDRDQDKLGNRTGEPNEVGHPQYGKDGNTPPDLTPEMRQEVLRLRERRQQMLQDLQCVLDDYATASAEERRAAVQAWREANAEAIAEQIQAAEQIRAQVREHAQANRPENPGQQGPNGEPADEARMEQLRQQNRTAVQERKQLSKDLQNAAEEERRQLVAQQRERRMEQVQQEIEQAQERTRLMNRETSMARLRDQLQAEAEMLRTREREQARDQLREQQEQAQQIRQTIQERIQIQAQERPDRPDQPERPDRPEQPEQPDRPDRPDRPERVTPGAGAGGDDAATRREQLMEQIQR